MYDYEYDNVLLDYKFGKNNNKYVYFNFVRPTHLF